ncbi:MAG: UrcA family protein [Caulobacterales bacterium]
MTFKKIIAALIVSFATVAVTPAFAGEMQRNARGEIAVNYADLDLTTYAGQEALVTRVTDIVRISCQQDFTTRSQIRRCREARMDQVRMSTTGMARQTLVAATTTPAPVPTVVILASND